MDRANTRLATPSHAPTASLGRPSASAISWISAGFEVVSSIGTGNDYTCRGGVDDWICVWKNQAQTAYTAQNVDTNQCTGSHFYSPYVMWSPNDNGRGSYYYCVHGQDFFRNEGDRWLD